MRIWSTMLAVVALLFGAPDSSRAQVMEVATIAAGTSVNGIIDNLKNSIIEIMSRLDQSVSSATFLTRMNMQILLADIEEMSHSIVGKTFGELNKSQQQFFNSADATIRQLQDATKSATANVDEVLKSAQLLVSMVPLTDKQPRLKGAGPAAVAYSEIADGKLDVTFDGVMLAHGPARLKLKDTQCELTNQTEFKATFRCSIAHSLDIEYPDPVPLVVDFQDDMGFFKWIMSFVGGGVDYKSYPLSVSIVPDKVADVTIIAMQENFVDKSNNRSMPFDTGARHCVDQVTTLVNITPSNSSWKIVPGSVNVAVGSSSGGGHRIDNLTEQGFQLYAWGNNRGSCGPFGIKDARGWHSGTINWTEVTQDSNMAAVNVEADPLTWGDRRIVKLPERTRSVIVKLRMFYGKIREYSGRTRDDFLFVDVDPGLASVTLDPKPLREAFR